MDPRISRLILAAAALGRVPFPTQNLFEAFGSPERILLAERSELESIEGMSPAIIRALVSAREQACRASQLAALEKYQVRLISFDEQEYPESLQRITDPPPVLFVKGHLLPQDRRSIAVIGSRKASSYGITICEEFVRGLAREGFSIVSGMARGIDTAAHWAAMENETRTIGVLGTGLDVIYPKANSSLFIRIPKEGALVSEFLPGTEARPMNFPRRNRIISGLVMGVLVVEAAERSGTMITVRMALEQGREVFAVPGDVRSRLSRGTHGLIKQGAKLVDNVEDILEELCHIEGEGRPSSSVTWGGAGGDGKRCPSPWNAEQNAQSSRPVLSSVSGQGAVHPEEVDTVLRLLSHQGTTMEILIQRTGWRPEIMTVLLTELELLGKVKRQPGGLIYPRT